MLAHEQDIGGLEGVRVYRNAPSISQLLFADDSLVLMRADSHNAGTLKRVLDTYCTSSGQLVSNAKSSIFFSPNTSVQVRETVCRDLNIMTEALSRHLSGPPYYGGGGQERLFSAFD